MKPSNLHLYEEELANLQASDNLRRLPQALHRGREIETADGVMLNLSSNDYLGLATDAGLRSEFLHLLTPENLLFTSSSSRLLTGNFTVYEEVENLLADLFGAESALVFNSGYHMNTGILPAVSNARTLILADKLVHASLIDGIRLSAARCVRFRHQDYAQLEILLRKHHAEYERIIIVTESVFSMDGDVADLARLVPLKHRYDNVMLYVDEAHGVGVRGRRGLGVAEEQGCVADIDFLCGTFGKALASVGGYVVCRRPLREYLVNRMRTLIFTTALPPVNLEWTKFILERLDSFEERRERLARFSSQLRRALHGRGYDCPSQSHILPIMVGDSHEAVRRAEEMRRKGFYVLPVRPPTVPEGTSRLRLSLTAALTQEDIDRLIINL